MIQCSPIPVQYHPGKCCLRKTLTKTVYLISGSSFVDTPLKIDNHLPKLHLKIENLSFSGVVLVCLHIPGTSRYRYVQNSGTFFLGGGDFWDILGTHILHTIWEPSRHLTQKKNINPPLTTTSWPKSLQQSSALQIMDHLTSCRGRSGEGGVFVWFERRDCNCHYRTPGFQTMHC